MEPISIPAHVPTAPGIVGGCVMDLRPLALHLAQALVSLGEAKRLAAEMAKQTMPDGLVWECKDLADVAKFADEALVKLKQLKHTDMDKRLRLSLESKEAV